MRDPGNEVGSSLICLLKIPGINEPKAPAKRKQHFNAKYPNICKQHLNATDRSIVGHNMLHVFGYPVATCCNMLQVENRNSAHAQAQHCCTNLTKRLQHHATSTNVAWKIWPFSNLSQHVATVWPNACNMLHPTMLRYVAIVWPGLINERVFF